MRKPYINNEIRSHVKRKHRLQKLYTKYPVTYEKQYKDWQNFVTRYFRDAWKRYFDRKLEKNSGIRKNMWSTINYVLGRNHFAK